MILKVFAVYDKAVLAFLRPFQARTHGEALRMFLQSVRENPDFHKNYKDYDLFFLSEFNDATGDYGVPAEQATSVPRIVMTGLEAWNLLQREAVPPLFAGKVDLSDEAQLADGSGC